MPAEINNLPQQLFSSRTTELDDTVTEKDSLKKETEGQRSFRGIGRATQVGHSR